MPRRGRPRIKRHPDDNIPKNWRAIRPSFIDSEFCRYENRDHHDIAVQEQMAVWVKLPDSTMEDISCDSCEGPHRPACVGCTGNLAEADTSYIVAGGSPDNGGVFLYNLYTRTRLPGVYRVTDLHMQGKRGSAVLVRVE